MSEDIRELLRLAREAAASRAAYERAIDKADAGSGYYFQSMYEEVELDEQALAEALNSYIDARIEAALSRQQEGNER